jgi:nicotinamidase-related amidase
MFRALSPPLLVCLDFQREYAAFGRPLFIAGFERFLERAAAVLDLARTEGWLVAHGMVRREGVLFGLQTEHARPLKGFEPRGAEMIFCREQFSVYGNRDFGRLLERNRGSVTFLMALGGPYSLLHTAFDAHARGDELTVIEDVVGAPDICDSAADQAAEVAKAIIGSMHRLIGSDEIFARAGMAEPTLEPAAPRLIERRA